MTQEQARESLEHLIFDVPLDEKNIQELRAKWKIYLEAQKKEEQIPKNHSLDSVEYAIGRSKPAEQGVYLTPERREIIKEFFKKHRRKLEKLEKLVMVYRKCFSDLDLYKKWEAIDKVIKAEEELKKDE